MSKPYSDIDFSDQITEDRAWRLREISDLKAAVSRADERLSRVLLRAMVALCYAHWEGYVRFAARKYLEHVALRKLRYGELERQFARSHFLPRLAAFSVSKSSVKEGCRLIDDIIDSAEARFVRTNEDLVSTGGNLNYGRFMDVCRVCAIPIAQFEEKASFIDRLLLKRRNEIAHGESTFIALSDLEELTSKTIELMRMFGDELENRVALKRYKSA